MLRSQFGYWTKRESVEDKDNSFGESTLVTSHCGRSHMGIREFDAGEVSRVVNRIIGSNMEDQIF